ncbi:MAG: hypothetical protein J5732_07410 [Bacteroidaceae bacterium]|nr:hypothetical protein [Bacteroidaceae bacterium]
MKKLVLTVLSVIMMPLFFVSCEKYTRYNDSEVTHWRSLMFTADGWTLYSDRDGTNSYFQADFDTHVLDWRVLEGGLVNCYIIYDDGSQAPLPNVRHYEDEYGHRWTRTLDCEYYEGGFSVFVTYSDFAREFPEKMSFRLTVAY